MSSLTLRHRAANTRPTQTSRRGGALRASPNPSHASRSSAATSNGPRNASIPPESPRPTSTESNAEVPLDDNFMDFTESPKFTPNGLLGQPQGQHPGPTTKVPPTHVAGFAPLSRPITGPNQDFAAFLGATSRDSAHLLSTRSSSAPTQGFMATSQLDAGNSRDVLMTAPANPQPLPPADMSGLQGVDPLRNLATGGWPRSFDQPNQQAPQGFPSPFHHRQQFATAQPLNRAEMEDILLHFWHNDPWLDAPSRWSEVTALKHNLNAMSDSVSQRFSDMERHLQQMHSLLHTIGNLMFVDPSKNDNFPANNQSQNQNSQGGASAADEENPAAGGSGTGHAQ